MNMINASGVVGALGGKGVVGSMTLDSDQPEALGLPAYGIGSYTDPAAMPEETISPTSAGMVRIEGGNIAIPHKAAQRK